MKHITAKITACVLSAAMAASMLSACDSASESGAKEMLLTAFDSMAKNAKNTWSAFSDDSSDKQTGSKATITVEPGEYLNDLAGVDLKEISMSSDVKIKGGILGSDLSISYDGQSIAGINTVIDEESEAGYIKVSELSDKYIKVPMDEASLSNLFDTSDLGVNLDTDYSDDSSEYMSDQTNDAEFKDIVNAFNEFDIKGIVNDVDTVIEEINKKIPESVDESERTIKENGVEAVFETKTVELSDDDKNAVLNAAKEALENSESIKACISKAGDYDSFINDLFESESDEDESSDNEKITFYYYGEKLVGFGQDNKNYLVSADTKDGYLTVLKANEDSDSISLVLTAVPDDKKLDIEFDLTADLSGSSDLTSALSFIDNSSATIKLKVDDFEIVNEDIGSYNANIEEELPIVLSDDSTLTCKIKAECKGDDNKQEESGEITVKTDGEDKSVLKYSGVSEHTDASDIKVPDESEYVAADSIDSIFTEDALADWGNQISDVLGEELISAITEKIGGLYGVSDDYDYTDESLLFDLEENYGISYYDYYDENFVDFDKDKFMEDVKEVYPEDKLDALEEEVDEMVKLMSELMSSYSE